MLNQYTESDENTCRSNTLCNCLELWMSVHTYVTSFESKKKIQ